MKRGLIFVLIVALMSLLTVSIGFGEQHEGAKSEEPASQEVAVEESPAFTIGNMVVCENVQNLSPVGTAEIFPATTPKVYGFLEAKDIEEDTNVSFVWYFEENQVAKVDLTLRTGDRWRTYSSKNIAGFKGDWKVELQDSTGKVLKAIAFRVE